jgi:preprotein translocase SecE subunit
MLSLRSIGQQRPLSQPRSRAAPPALRLPACHAIEEKRDTPSTTGRTAPDDLSAEQMQKLADLRRQGQQGRQDGNLVQGALEEAQLISWPSPQKAVLDTVLVLAIVTASGFLLFGFNVLLADVATWWYAK